MRKSISLILLLTLPLISFSLNHPYKRLNKLYEADSEKCLVVAENYIKFFPGNPAPYFFAMSVHFDKAKEGATSRKKYNEMSKALSMARRYSRVRSDKFDAKVGWDEKAESMNVFTEKLIVELKEDKLGRLKTSLISKRKALRWKKVKLPADTDLDNDNLAKVEEVKKVEDANTVESVSMENRVAGQFYGLAKGSENVPSFDVSSEQEMLSLINAERKRLGMGPLVWDENLAKAARYHAFDMGTQKYFEHDSYDRSGEKLTEVAGTFKRIRNFYTDSFVNSENIAAGNQTAQATYNQWFHSPGHYANMFKPSSKKVGIGVVYSEDSPFGYYWVFDSAL